MADTPLEIFLNKSVMDLKGISVKKAASLRKLGINTIGDIIMNVPRSYEDRRNIKKIADVIVGDTATVIGKVVSFDHVFIRKNLTITSVLIQDGTSSLFVKFYNQNYLEKVLVKGRTYLFYGTVQAAYEGPVMEMPAFSRLENKDEFAIIHPIYSLTKGVSQYMIQKLVKDVLNVVKHFKDTMPPYIVDKYHLMSKDEAIRNIHFPKNEEFRSKARFRLAFEELLELQLLLHSIKEDTISNATGIQFKKNNATKKFIENLPFKLTNAQLRVWSEIEEDMASDRIMNRLVIGDVGSGKTIVAVLAMLNAIVNGYQALYMAPTEILAEQHMKTVSSFLNPLGIKTGLLTGSLPVAKKRQLLEEIASGQIHCVVGTHALIQRNVTYDNVGIVITDEQHRFGVRQRAQLASKGKTPDVLVMTATPIPRTLALILYGDMDLSTIDELPAGRIPIKTYAVDSTMRDRILAWAKKLVMQNQQIYIVHPAVEESENMNLLSATENYNKLSSTVFKDIPTGLVHGKMSAKEKEAVMRDFVSGRIKILFSTTVIEVGVDVPSATLMIIENAERFGLSQLHQLRGRVGRNNMQSYCVMITDSKTDLVKERMTIMVKTNDGFKISEKDLELRGPGDLFGTQQHGIPEFAVANLYEDLDILKLAQDAAFAIMKNRHDEQTAMYVKSVIKKAEGMFHL